MSTAHRGKPRGIHSAPPHGEHSHEEKTKKPSRQRQRVTIHSRTSLTTVEIVPAILRKHFEDVASDWEKVRHFSPHIQLDITDGVFAGDGTFRELRRFKQLPESEKIELHMMVHTPSRYLADIIDLAPARCVFHLESFEGTNDLWTMYQTLREQTETELALAINPTSPNARLEEYLDLVHYILFMGYQPGFAHQEVEPQVFVKIGQFHERHPDIPVAVDGHVGRDTVSLYVNTGARILCANTAIFGKGDPYKNYLALKDLAEAALSRGILIGNEKIDHTE